MPFFPTYGSVPIARARALLPASRKRFFPMRNTHVQKQEEEEKNRRTSIIQLSCSFGYGHVNGVFVI